MQSRGKGGLLMVGKLLYDGREGGEGGESAGVLYGGFEVGMC